MNTLATSPPAVAPRARSLSAELAPLCALVFLEFLAMGLPLSQLPARVHEQLGFGTFVVGLAVGAQSWATLATRHSAGTRADQRGPRAAALLGLGLSSAAGSLYALSLAVRAPGASLLVLLLGRGLLGVGESLVVTGALSWGVALAGRERSGVVMAWVGIAMYGALALGAPLGSLLDARAGFLGVSLAAALAPAAGLLPALLARPVEPAGGQRMPFTRVLAALRVPGAGLALAALSFGAIAAFSSLRFAEQGWSHAPLLWSSFGAAYILARLLFGKLPDRLGGARVAAASSLLAALGQAGLWLAPSAHFAIASAALSGFGFSLTFPAFGIEALRRVPPQNRGAALGAYTAFFDAALGLGVPALGALVGRLGYGAAFAASALGALGSFALALSLGTRALR